MTKTFEQYSAAQGWNKDSEHQVLLDFISKHNLDKKLATTAQEYADIENDDFFESEEDFALFMKNNPDFGKRTFAHISELQGWNIESQNNIILSFIEEFDFKPQLAEHCKNYQ